MRSTVSTWLLSAAFISSPMLANADTYLPSNSVVVDAYIAGDELTQSNNGSIKVVEYNEAEINFNYSFDTTSHIFTAPETGLYSIDARYAQRTCGFKYLLRIGISLPNAVPPGSNASIGPVTFANNDTGCAIPGVAAVSSIMKLEKGETLFIQARYQRAQYDVSPWNYKNRYQNRLVITYLGCNFCGGPSPAS
ncbi:hypothetical protein [Enterovibrio coralii]|uniref:C1q domain-containing protein n=1 Tax=Enterovibrio coralii TaxID=294935 RepID=A0A135ICG9_9GAMM|nr:hypothetical protein [Enterovibrio coralii]KXF83167.1 hypothetical protein ATN88_05555 [Enterovibrio coralii]